MTTCTRYIWMCGSAVYNFILKGLRWSSVQEPLEDPRWKHKQSQAAVCIVYPGAWTFQFSEIAFAGNL